MLTEWIFNVLITKMMAIFQNLPSLEIARRLGTYEIYILISIPKVPLKYFSLYFQIIYNQIF
jgi:hypothetical protein